MHGYLPRQAQLARQLLAERGDAVLLDLQERSGGFPESLLARADDDSIDWREAPKLSRGFHELVEQLQPEQASLIAQVETSFEIRPGIWVQPPLEVGQQPA